jgi:threonine dehydrogenase-like Zn-dependent dehydrogenase
MSTASAPAIRPCVPVGTMRAGVITAPGRVVLEERPIPCPGPGQVLIRLEGCGVCGSNIPAWQGREWFSYPLDPGQPGHEGWGAIEAVGEGVTGIGVGERVAALSYNAFAEYDVANAACVVPLPMPGPFPAEPFGCAINAFERCGIRPGQTVAIVGYGFFGALLGQLAKNAGARTIAVARRANALKTACSLGIESALPLEDHASVIEKVRRLTRGRMCEVVIEAAGAQETLDLATQLAAERGRLVITGFHQDGPRTIDMFTWNWRGLDVINAHERDPAVYTRGMREAVRAVAAGRLNPTPLYTHMFPLERLAEALDTAARRPEGFMKALVITGASA